MKPNIINFLFIVLLVILSSCHSVQYVPVEKVKTEYVSSSDTVIIKDSVFVNQYIKGDTVYRDRDKYHNTVLIKNDTIIRVDSIPVIQIVEKPVYIEKKLNIVQKGTMYLGFGVLLIGMLYLLYKCIKGRLI